MRLLPSGSRPHAPGLSHIQDRIVTKCWEMKQKTGPSQHFVLGFYEADVVKAPLRKNVLKFFGSF
jgi:hypothetical protein